MNSVSSFFFSLLSFPYCACSSYSAAAPLELRSRRWGKKRRWLWSARRRRRRRRRGKSPAGADPRRGPVCRAAGSRATRSGRRSVRMTSMKIRLAGLLPLRLRRRLLRALQSHRLLLPHRSGRSSNRAAALGQERMQWRKQRRKRKNGSALFKNPGPTPYMRLLPSD